MPSINDGQPLDNRRRREGGARVAMAAACFYYILQLFFGLFSLASSQSCTLN